VVIDAFIGEPAMLGCGHGSAFLRVVGEKLLAEGAPIVAIDPDRDNHRARRAYTRAGFVEENIVQAANGPLLLCFCHSGITPDLCSDLDETVDLMADRLQKSFPRPQRDARCYSFI
jgi:hypothetical protein